MGGLLIVPAVSYAILALRGPLWVKGDDNRYHAMQPDATGAWSEQTDSALVPALANYGSVNLGPRVYLFGLDGLWHAFELIGKPGEWTDVAQSAGLAVSAARSFLVGARVDDGLYMLSPAEANYHKFTILGGAWADVAQGYTVPM
jgi:hypothetical protein